MCSPVVRGPAARLGRRSGESLPGHRISARALRMSAYGAAVDVVANARLRRRRHELFHESDKVAFRKGCPGVVGAGRTVRTAAGRKRAGSRWRASRSVCGECAAWESPARGRVALSPNGCRGHANASFTRSGRHEWKTHRGVSPAPMPVPARHSHRRTRAVPSRVRVPIGQIRGSSISRSTGSLGQVPQLAPMENCKQRIVDGGLST